MNRRSFHVTIPDANTPMAILPYDFACKAIVISFYEQSRPDAIVWVGESPDIQTPDFDENTGGPESNTTTGVRGEAVYERDTATFQVSRPSDLWVACATADIKLGVSVIL